MLPCLVDGGGVAPNPDGSLSRPGVASAYADCTLSLNQLLPPALYSSDQKYKSCRLHQIMPGEAFGPRWHSTSRESSQKSFHQSSPHTLPLAGSHRLLPPHQPPPPQPANLHPQADGGRVGDRRGGAGSALPQMRAVPGPFYPAQ